MMKTSTNYFAAFSTAILISSIIFAQSYCIPPGFRDMGGAGEPFTFISNVQLENLNNTSGMPTGVGEDNGYTYYNNAPTPVLQQGKTYSLKVTANDNLGSGMEVAVWVDWNGDKEFNKNGEKVAFWAPAGNHGADITVPSNIADGVVRMRVACDMPPGMGHIPLEPCGYLDYPSHAIGIHGEFEDYDLVIGSTVGINKVDESASLKVFPNPANQILNIEFASENDASYIVYDMYGRQLLLGQLKNSVQAVDVSALQTGKYIIMIEDASSTVHRPFFISH